MIKLKVIHKILQSNTWYLPSSVPSHIVGCSSASLPSKSLRLPFNVYPCSPRLTAEPSALILLFASGCLVSSSSLLSLSSDKLSALLPWSPSTLSTVPRLLPSGLILPPNTVAPPRKTKNGVFLNLTNFVFINNGCVYWYQGSTIYKRWKQEFS